MKLQTRKTICGRDEAGDDLVRVEFWATGENEDTKEIVANTFMVTCKDNSDIITQAIQDYIADRKRRGTNYPGRPVHRVPLSKDDDGVVEYGAALDAPESHVSGDVEVNV